MEQWQKNLEVIQRGGGSEQARYCDEECPICNDEEDEEEDNNRCQFYANCHQCLSDISEKELSQLPKDCKHYRVLELGEGEAGRRRGRKTIKKEGQNERTS